MAHNRIRYPLLLGYRKDQFLVHCYLFCTLTILNTTPNFKQCAYVCSTQRTDPPWLNMEVQHVIKRRNTAWRKSKHSGSNAAWCKYKRVRDKLQIVLRLNHSQLIHGFDAKIKNNPKAFWSFVKLKTGQGSIPDTLFNHSIRLNENSAKAIAFNEHFHSVFNKAGNVDIYPEFIPLTS